MTLQHNAGEKDFSTNHATYLLTWNPRKYDWENFQDDWEDVYFGNRPLFEWSCGNTRKIRVGDRIFLMRLGWRERITGIVASGWITGEPKNDQHWEDPEGSALYVQFEPDVLLNPEIDKLLNPKLVSQNFNWHPQRAGVTIPTEIAIHLEQIWQQHVHKTGFHDEPTTQSIKGRNTYTEGDKKLVTSYRYERDPQAREECIRQYGTLCAVCGFDFGEIYGDIGEGFIHVHHLTPIARHETEYVIDPVKDMRPVCPNCHAMLHRRSPPYSIEELQYIRKEASETSSH